jgi:hypothetical protein
MANLKHVGRQVNNKRRCVIAYRVIPNDPDHCLVVFSENLESADHDSLMKAVESNAGQNAYEFAEAMSRTTLVDGRNMLAAFHQMGKLVKRATKDIELVPNTQTAVNLAEVNEAVAQQKGVTVADLALQAGSKTNTTPAPDATQAIVEEPTVESTGVLSDEELAAQYRSQADALFKEAKALREQAEELVPTKKKTTKKTESA